MYRLGKLWIAVGLLVGGVPMASHAGETTFNVTVPDGTPAGDSVYIAGSFQGWDPGDPAYELTRVSDRLWTLTLSLADGLPIEFKFTRGTWGRVEKGICGEEIANRVHTVDGDEILELTVETWVDVPTITGHVELFSYAPFLGGRECWVYLPPGYAESGDAYPVLYMQDGQNLFDVHTSFACEWRMDEALEELIPAGEIDPIIVVGIANGQGSRCFEYTPWFDSGVGCGGGGDSYLQAVRDVLIPEIDRRYRTRTGPEHTYIGGSSLGGLISIYAGYEYDETWSRVAGVSPSYWFADHRMFEYAQAQSIPDLAKLYQDMGDGEGGSADEDGNGIPDVIDDLRAMRDIALSQGFIEGETLQSVEAAGHEHNEYWWSLRVPDILRWVVGSSDPSSVDSFQATPGLELDAFPNPYRSGRLDLMFTLPEPQRVRLDLYDARGRFIRKLMERDYPSGEQIVTWDGRDGMGRRLPGGVYWVRLSAGDDTIAKRVAVVP